MDYSLLLYHKQLYRLDQEIWKIWSLKFGELKIVWLCYLSLKIYDICWHWQLDSGKYL